MSIETYHIDTSHASGIRSFLVELQVYESLIFIENDPERERWCRMIVEGVCDGSFTENVIREECVDIRIVDSLGEVFVDTLTKKK